VEKLIAYSVFFPYSANAKSSSLALRRLPIRP
jgi:hypothetical protein